jgi:hypothetical protein
VFSYTDVNGVNVANSIATDNSPSNPGATNNVVSVLPSSIY